MASGHIFLLAAVVMLSVLQVTQCCVCLFKDEKEIVCSADFVVKATVESYTPPSRPDDNTLVSPFYTMHVDEIFKSNSVFDSLIGEDGIIKVNNLYLTSCEVNFNVGQTYLIIGRANAGSESIILSNCDTSRQWDALSEEERFIFTEKFIGEGKCDC